MSLRYGCFCFFVVFISEVLAHQTIVHPQVLFISVSGLNQVVLHHYESSLPTLHDWFHAGSAVRNVKAVFPAQTQPTLWTLMTGVYTKEHGVFFDLFPPNVTSVEPFYLTNRNGEGRNSSILGGFPGVSGSCVKPKNDDQSILDQVLPWFDDMDHPINLGMVHYGTMKNAQDESQLKEELGKFDAFLNTLGVELEKRHLTTMNIVIFGDSGMASVNREFEFNMTNNRLHTYDTVIAVEKGLGAQRLVSDQLSAVSGISVFKEGDTIPTEWHWPANFASTPFELIAFPNASGVAFTNVPRASWFADASTSDGFLVVRGPAFQKEKIVEEAQLVDLYPLLCKVLDIKPRPNSGSLDRVRVLLLERPVAFSTVVVGLTMVFVLVPCLLFSIRALRNCDKHIDPKHSRPDRLLPQNDRKMMIGHRPLVSTDDDDDDSL